ncbi:MAG: ATP-binding protein [Candidatus Paceibacterota bacterium]
MLIRTKIKTLLSFLVLVFSIGFLANIFWLNTVIKSENQKNQAIQNVIASVAELDVLTNDYILFTGDRGEAQWRLKFSSFFELLGVSVFEDNVEEQETLVLISQRAELLGESFNELVLFNKQGGANSPEGLTIQRELVSQLSSNVRNVVADTLSLAHFVGEATARRQKISLATVGTAGAIFLLIGWIASASLIKSISRPLNKLTRFVDQLSKGKLSKKVDRSLLLSRDEIGRLAVSFDEMSRKLTKSLKDLEGKVAETKEEKAKLETLIETIPLGIYLVKFPTGEPLMINQRGTELLENAMTPNARPGQYSKVNQIVKEDGSPYPENELPLSITLRTGEIVTKSDIFLRKPDDTVVAVRSTSVPVKDGQGKNIAALLVFQDITKEKAVDRAKSEFISIASHQLRTPLAAIYWLVESFGLSLENVKLTDLQKGYLDDLSNSIERAVRLVEDLLSVSRLQLGSLEVKKDKVNIVSFIEHFMSDFDFYAKSKKHKVIFRKAIGESVVVETDPKLLYTIVQNLMTNAVDYSPPNTEVVIEVLQEGGSIRMLIANSGPVIPKHEQKNIFQKFYRGESAKKTKTEGTGLGLFIVKSFVNKLGGKVDFKSEKDETVFWFTIPRKS